MDCAPETTGEGIGFYQTSACLLFLTYLLQLSREHGFGWLLEFLLRTLRTSLNQRNLNQRGSIQTVQRKNKDILMQIFHLE